MGPFASAVTESVRTDSGCWEAIYYQRSGWSAAARNVYMHSRWIALGPEWGELQRTILHMKYKPDTRRAVRAGLRFAKLAASE